MAYAETLTRERLLEVYVYWKRKRPAETVDKGFEVEWERHTEIYLLFVYTCLCYV